MPIPPPNGTVFPPVTCQLSVILFVSTASRVAVKLWMVGGAASALGTSIDSSATAKRTESTARRGMGELLWRTRVSGKQVKNVRRSERDDSQLACQFGLR